MCFRFFSEKTLRKFIVKSKMIYKHLPLMTAPLKGQKHNDQTPEMEYIWGNGINYHAHGEKSVATCAHNKDNTTKINTSNQIISAPSLKCSSARPRPKKWAIALTGTQNFEFLWMRNAGKNFTLQDSHFWEVQNCGHNDSCYKIK